jgi:AAA family ATP:ADP antiporter
MSNSEDAATQDDGEKTLLDKALGVFAEVKGGEGLTAVIMTFTVFFLLVGYYLLKTVREPLILATVPEGGAELKSYTTAGQAVLLIGFVQGYAVLTRRLKRMTLISVCWLFFASNLVLFWVMAQLKVPYLGIAFFLWLGCFSVTVIAQFWSFANDIYSQEQGKRLFAIIGIGMSVGAVGGSYLAKQLIKPIGPFPMMLVAAALLGACLLLVWVVNAREQRRPRNAATDDKPVGGKAGFAMMLEDRYLLLIGALILLLNWVNTTGEFILDKRILEAAQPIVDAAGADAEARKKALETFVGEWRGDFFTWVNALGAILQFFFVSRIFKYLGVRVALFSLPLISFAASGVMAFVPVLAAARVVKIAENATDYSLYNTVKQALWLPTSRQAKYNAKAAVDTFIVRIGDLLSGGTVALGTALGFGVTHFALLNLGLIAVWITVVVLLARDHKKREEETPEGRAAAKKEVGATA